MANHLASVSEAGRSRREEFNLVYTFSCFPVAFKNKLENNLSYW